jgi:hypothetical protein
MTRPYDPDLALFWWEHLTKEQRAFLEDNWGQNYTIQEWYEFSLKDDLQGFKRLSGESWPTTPDTVFRSI